jgi:hypothetical protein
MYENLCGNCEWNRVDICMTFHKRTFDVFNSITHALHIDLTTFKIVRL